MARNKGIASFSANFEPQVAAPLDARNYVPTKAELSLSATWLANDGSPYAYPGMVVSVYADSTPTNNGLYQLLAADYTQAASWNFIGAAVGGASGPPTVTGIASGNLGGGKVVRWSGGNLALADSSNIIHIGKIAGVTTGAALDGATTTAQTSGILEDSAFAFTPDMPVYFNTAGALTHTLPSVGFIQSIGVAVATTKLFIHLETPIQL